MSPQTVHQFAERVALVSDAGSRIGRAVSMQLALQGSFVIGLFPRAASEQEASVSELVELGTLAHGAAIDPSTMEGARAAAETVNGLFGRLDLLVNCLKYTPESSFETMTEPDFHAVVGQNLGSAFFLTQSVIGLMKIRPKPKIVNLISAADSRTEPIFAATQAAVAGLTRSLAATLPDKFRTNCVQVNERQEQTETADELFLRPGSIAPDDVARAVLFLLSSESIGMNGQVVTVG
jgi:NAD(P)-dependent dehydrogenase (short-subunit alcohol dehydrogenase family)